MKIPFHDSRTGAYRRWTDYKKWKKLRFSELYELIDGCKDLGKIELMELSSLIEKKLKAFEQYRKA